MRTPVFIGSAFVAKYPEGAATSGSVEGETDAPGDDPSPQNPKKRD